MAVTCGSAPATQQDGHRTNAENHVQGEETDQASERRELTGIYGVLLLAQMLCRSTSIAAEHLGVACDNLSAGQKAIEWEYPPKPANDHFDMLAAIHSLRKALPITTEFRHVEAHQREKYRTRPLDKWAVWNDEMDALATAYWSFTRNAAIPSSAQIQGNEWAVWVKGQKICKNFRAAIREAIHTDRLTAWWMKSSRTKQAKFTPAQIELMDTTAAKAAWSHTNTARRRWICKNAADLIPVGRNMKRWRFWRKNNCPRCLHEDETTVHVQRCQDPRAIAHRDLALAKFHSRLRILKTNRNIRWTIYSQVRAWMTNTIPTQRVIPQELRAAVRAQHSLGWNQFMKGRIVKDWAPIQEADFTRRRLRNSGKTWSAGLTSAIWELAWQMWDHRNEILHNTDVSDQLLDMDGIDFSILEEWHAGYDDLEVPDRLHFRGLTLDGLLAKNSRYRREWLMHVQTARAAVRELNEPGDHEPDNDSEPETYID